MVLLFLAAIAVLAFFGLVTLLVIGLFWLEKKGIIVIRDR